ncbi:radical SAM protein [Elusimicrobiota bacterium]
MIYKLAKKTLIEIEDFVELINRQDYAEKLKSIIEDIKENRTKSIIRLSGIPICYFKRNIGKYRFIDYLLMTRNNNAGRNGYQEGNCRDCLYVDYCKFSYSDQEILKRALSPIENLPEEISIEVTGDCNLDCEFCFQRYDNTLKNKNIFIVPETVYNILSICNDYGIKRVRFSGGEPLLHENILDFMKTAKLKGLKVVLSTNSLLIDRSFAEKLVKHVDQFEIPILDHAGRLDGFSGNMQQKKIKAVKYLYDEIKKQKLEKKEFRANTVLTSENYRNLNFIYKLIKDLKFTSWGINRLVPAERDTWFPTENEIGHIVNTVYKLKKKEKTMFIDHGNGLPFCCCNPLIMDYTSVGTYWENCRNRIFIDPRGYIKPFYYDSKYLGEIQGVDSVIKAWKDPYVSRFREGLAVPEVCKNCFFQFKCGGGNRFCAYKQFNDYQAEDILYNRENVRDYYYV